MLQAFLIVLREGMESFLIVAITFAYLRKTSQQNLVTAVLWGILGAFLASAGLGYFLWVTQGENQPLIEGIFAVVTVILVVTFVLHMTKMGPTLKKDLENKLSEATAHKTGAASWWGVFLFTLFMISREGMETALLLIQIHAAQIVAGAALGLAAAGFVAIVWQQFGYAVNLKHFFRVTAFYLLFFTLQIAFQAFHEFCEAGILPNSTALHAATEPFSSDGLYGKWYTGITVAGCGLWLCFNLLTERFSLNRSRRA